MNNALLLSTSLGLFNKEEVEEAVKILHVSRIPVKNDFKDEQFSMKQLCKRWVNSDGEPCSRVNVYNAEKKGLKRIPGIQSPKYWLSEIIRYENTTR